MSPQSVRLIHLRLIAVALHILLFSSTWIAYWLQKQPLANGPAFWPFFVLLLVDLPISIVAFGIMWGKNGFLYGLILWGCLGTIWWYWLVGMISRLTHRSSGS
jgi:hypothetical protein